MNAPLQAQSAGERRVWLPEQTEVGNYFVSNYPPYSRWSPTQVAPFVQGLQQNTGNGPLGLYVHIPFCRQRCSYCYFRVHPRRPAEEVEAYISALLAEAQTYSNLPSLAGRPIANLYLGGGTPTFLNHAQLRRLLSGLRSHLNWSGASEVTCECQPGTLDREKLILLRGEGVTRASIGVQTFTEQVLRGIGRAASVGDCIDAFAMAREAGFPEVNIDLIAGLPGEIDESWSQSIESAIALNPDAITIYQLELTHNSPLFKITQGERSLNLPTWPEKRRWVRAAFERLEQAGYTVYGAYWAVRDPSRSRFAYVTKHYWKGHDLLALGESAFGLLGGFHYQNSDNYGEYVSKCAAGELPVRRAYYMSEEECLRREFILALKTGRADLAELGEKFGIDVAQHLAEPLQALRAEGLLSFDSTKVQLTRDGLLSVDWLLPEFYLPQHRGVRYT